MILCYENEKLLLNSTFFSLFVCHCSSSLIEIQQTVVELSIDNDDRMYTFVCKCLTTIVYVKNALYLGIRVGEWKGNLPPSKYRVELHSKN